MKDRKRAVWWADLFYSHCKCLSAGFNTDPNFPRCPRLALGAALHSGMLLRVKKKGLSVEACPSPVGFSLSWLFLFALCFLLALSFVTCDMLDSVCMSAPVCFQRTTVCFCISVMDFLTVSSVCFWFLSPLQFLLLCSCSHSLQCCSL